MVDDSNKYNLNLLRGWKRNQLKLLKVFTYEDVVPQTRLSGASGMRAGSHALGGKITPLVRANLIQKAGRDDDGNYMWKLNEDTVSRKALKEFLEPFKLEEK